MSQLQPFQQWVVQLFAMLGELGTFLLAIVGFLGLRSYWRWREEYTSKRKYELAVKVISLTNQLKDGISTIRNPIGYSGEEKGRAIEEGETIEERDTKNFQYATSRRHDAVKDTLQEIYKAKLEAEIIFGKYAGVPIGSLLKLYSKLVTDTQIYFHIHLRRAGSRSLSQVGLDQLEKAEKTVFWTGGDEDKYWNEVLQAVQDIEATFDKCLKK